MDYWCALWFWPIDKADLLPTRSEFLFDMSLILEGTMASVNVTDSVKGGQLSLFPTEMEQMAMDIIDTSVLLLKELPCGLVVLLTVTAVKGGNILNGTLHRTAGHGVIHDRAIEFLTGRSILHVQLKLFPVETNPHETTVVGKGDSTVGIIPSICLIALQHRELDAVDSFQLLQRHAQG